MRLLFIDPEGTGLSWALRSQDEGAQVLYYVHPRWQREVGQNLVRKTDSLHAAFAWAKEEAAVAVFLSSGMGKRGKDTPVGADDFRRAGIEVIGGGSFCDRLETDRAFGEHVAKSAGCRLPPTKTFSTIAQAIAFARTVGDEAWYFKSDRYLESDATYGGKDGEDLARYLEALQKKFGNAIPNVLQQKIPGVALSTGCWWNGSAFVPPFEATIEHKKFLDGDLGPSTGCAFCAVWFFGDEQAKVVKSLHWDGLTPIFRQHDAPACLYDMNAVVASKDGPWGPAGEAYFLEWTPRNGWDSEMNSQRLLTSSMPDFLERLVQGRLSEAPFDTSKIAYSTRLSVQPYPFEHYAEDKHSAKGTPIYGADGLWEKHFVPYSVGMNDDGDLYLADRWGLLGVSLSVGDTLSQLHASALHYATKELEVPSIQTRTDGASCIAKDASALKRLGYEVPNGLAR